jgi:mono/diheme cytochrome c family protein
MGLIVLLACAGGDDSADDFCADAPTVTYETFGAGFLRENCQTCHSSTAVDRHGAPDSVTFDDVDQAWSWSDRILVRAAADPPDMPPEGGTTDDARTLLKYWLTCAEEGT